MYQLMHYKNHSVFVLKAEANEAINMNFFKDCVSCLDNNKHVWVNVYLLDQLSLSWKYVLLFMHSMFNYKKRNFLLLFPNPMILESVKKKEFISLKVARNINHAMDIQSEEVQSKPLNFFKSLLHVTQYKLLVKSHISYLRGKVFLRPKDFKHFTANYNCCVSFDYEQMNFVFTISTKEKLFDDMLPWFLDLIIESKNYSSKSLKVKYLDPLEVLSNGRFLSIFEGLGQTVVVPLISGKNEFYLEFWIPQKHENELMKLLK